MSPRLLLPAIGILLFCSCHDESNVLFPDPLNPNQETFRSSLFVTISDTSGSPVSEATVRIGNTIAQTNEDGFVHFNNVKLGKSSYLTIEKEGFFHASRRFYPTEGVAENIQIILLPVSRKAFFQSSSGANFVEEGLSITFPAEGYQFPNGDPYNGTVLVYSTTIKADDPDLSYKMPGDLVGIMGDGSNVALASMGMFGVELRTASGELLKLKDGVSAEVQMEVPSTLTNLPPTIPLWHFDEVTGIWREEGQAILSGNTYTGAVTHFSYWNYDAWFPIVKWGVQINYATPDRNNPAIYAQVCITILSMNVKKCAFTNSDGFICGMVAANELLQLDVYGSCGALEYSEVIGPFSDTTMMLPIFIDTPQSTSVEGLAVDCKGNPLDKGYAIINNGYNLYIPLEEGIFSTTFTSCNELPFSVSVLDATNLKESKTSFFEPGYFVDADTIVVCEDLTEFVIFNIDGNPNPIIITPLQYRHTQDGHFISNNFIHDSIHHVHFKIDPAFTGIYTTISAHISLNAGGTNYYNDKADLKIEEFGNATEFIKGQIKGLLFTGEIMEGYPYTASFSVRRI